MITVLSISSQVTHGYVGNSAATFALERLGIEVMPAPTIVLSSHAGHKIRAGITIPPPVLDQMLGALEANGWLARLDALAIGYLPSPEHVALAARWGARLKSARPELITLCDPILGDEPGGLYVDRAVAEAVRVQMIPLADILTPNRFELGWLTGRAILTLEDARAAARALGVDAVLVTSAPSETEDELTNLLIGPEEAWRTHVRRRASVPHGSGDLLAALFLGHYLKRFHKGGGVARSSATALKEALAYATTGLEAVLDASRADTLALIASQALWAQPAPWPVDSVS